MIYLGDYIPGSVVYRYFNTRQADPPTPVTIVGGAVAVFKGGNPAEAVAGVTFTADFDSRVGLHQVIVNTAADAAFYSAGSDFEIVLTAGTVAGLSVANTSLAKFSLGNRWVDVNAAQVGGVDATLEAGTIPARLTADGLDLVMAEAGVDVRQAISLLLAYNAGVKSLVTTDNPVVKNPAGTAVRVTLVVDMDGNCTAATLMPYNP